MKRLTRFMAATVLGGVAATGTAPAAKADPVQRFFQTLLGRRCPSTTGARAS